jgi:hypothetical protein
LSSYHDYMLSAYHGYRFCGFGRISSAIRAIRLAWLTRLKD